LWLLVACDEGLVLPAPPGEQPPAIASVEPGRAFAGDRVTITGRSLTTAGQPGVVRFGASSPAQDVQVVEGALVARVPDDATAGPVTVTTGAGSGSGAFTYAGLGRLRRGQLAAVADLRTAPTRALRAGPWIGYLDVDRWDAFVVARGEFWTRNLPGRNLVDAARVGETTYVLGHDGDASAAVARGRVLRIVDGARRDQVDFSLEDAAAGWPDRIAVDEQGHAAIVDANQGLGVLDYPTGRWDRLASQGVARAVARCADGFVVVVAPQAGQKVVSRVRATAAGWRVEPQLALVGPHLVEDVACHGDTAAVLTQLGEVIVVRLAGGASEKLGHFATLGSGASDGRLAFSTGGTRIFFSQPEEGRVVTLELAGQGIKPLQSVALERPRGIDVNDDGTLLVACRGGAARLSQETGSVVEMVRLSADLQAPTLRMARGFGDGGLEPVLEVNARTFARIARLVPRTLATHPDILANARYEDDFTTTVAGAEGGVLLAATDASTFVRYGEDLASAEDADSLVAPSGTFFAGMGLGPDGALFAGLLADGESLALAGLLVGSATGSLADAHARLPPVPGLTAFLRVGRSAIARGTTSGVQLLDREAALAGVERYAGFDFGLKAREDQAELATFEGGFSDRHFIAWHDDGANDAMVRFVRLPDGPMTSARLPQFVRGATLSPSGRQLWWVQQTSEVGREGATRVELLSCHLDPDAATAGPCEDGLALPDGAGALTVAADGEALFFTQHGSDRVWRIE
jgi:hypothetical protein